MMSIELADAEADVKKTDKDLSWGEKWMHRIMVGFFALALLVAALLVRMWIAGMMEAAK